MAIKTNICETPPSPMSIAGTMASLIAPTWVPHWGLFPEYKDDPNLMLSTIVTAFDSTEARRRLKNFSRTERKRLLRTLNSKGKARMPREKNWATLKAAAKSQQELKAGN